jgi:alkanesulfonate monooxygenase SsuD/methylene tetrahydromethanopterin reductase-like flavin-dependent oxidoreductase (luciferase family)
MPCVREAALRAEEAAFSQAGDGRDLSVLHLTVSLVGSGYHPASWRVSRFPPRPDAAAIQQMARVAERGKLDAVLLGLPVDNASGADKVSALPLDPLPVLGSLIGVTQRIGIAASWTIDYTEPFHVARVFASLDHLSYGRTAWVADMFGSEALAPRIGRPPQAIGIPEYCQRAGEFIDVVRKLWDSWEDAALALDKASGTFVDPEHVHPVEFAGEFFAVRGPLNVPRPPQGNPLVIMHDPADRDARQFAAVTADVVLMSCENLAQARERYRELQSLAVPNQLRVLANIGVTLGETEAAANRRAAELDAIAAPPAGLRFVGTPEQLVELFAGWEREGACDGFNLLPAVLEHIEPFVDRVIPLAQKTELFRRDYAGTTLREHLGLARPRSQYEGAA